MDPAGRKLLLHSFRHTYATLMAEQVQNNPHFLKSVLGHSKISTTDRYCQVEPRMIPIGDLNQLLAQKQGKPEQQAAGRIVPINQTA